jgi:hypothetical protein
MLIAEEEEEKEEGGLDPSYASKPSLSLLGLQQDISFHNRGKKQQQQLLLRELTNVRGRRMSSSVSPSWWVHLLQQPRRNEGSICYDKSGFPPSRRRRRRRTNSCVTSLHVALVAIS